MDRPNRGPGILRAREWLAPAFSRWPRRPRREHARLTAASTLLLQRLLTAASSLLLQRLRLTAASTHLVQRLRRALVAYSFIEQMIHEIASEASRAEEFRSQDLPL